MFCIYSRARVTRNEEVPFRQWAKDSYVSSNDGLVDVLQA